MPCRRWVRVARLGRPASASRCHSRRTAASAWPSKYISIACATGSRCQASHRPATSETAAAFAADPVGSLLSGYELARYVCGATCAHTKMLDAHTLSILGRFTALAGLTRPDGPGFRVAASSLLLSLPNGALPVNNGQRESNSAARSATLRIGIVSGYFNPIHVGQDRKSVV